MSSGATRAARELKIKGREGGSAGLFLLQVPPAPIQQMHPEVI